MNLQLLLNVNTKHQDITIVNEASLSFIFLKTVQRVEGIAYRPTNSLRKIKATLHQIPNAQRQTKKSKLVQASSH